MVLGPEEEFHISPFRAEKGAEGPNWGDNCAAL